MNFNEKNKFYVKLINDKLEDIFKNHDCLERSVYDAMSYSVLAGGKRIRPVLTLAICDMLGGEIEDALRFAIGIECIHTYSLIHDDLPCMDNDDLRRGRPTCHKKFDEATALLAGDGLLTFAFEYMSDLSAFKKIDAASALKAINEITKSAGCSGMIGGQIVDLMCERERDLDEATLTYMHNRKTGELIKAAVLSGAICGGANEKEAEALLSYALSLGLAFQIQDDILDCIGDSSLLGKTIGSDIENEKSTYVSLLGLENAKQKAKALTQSAIDALKIFGNKAEFLVSVANYLMVREN